MKRHARVAERRIHIPAFDRVVKSYRIMQPSERRVVEAALRWHAWYRGVKPAASQGIALADACAALAKSRARKGRK